MSDARQNAVDATIAGLDHSDLWNGFWRNPGSGVELTGLMEAYLPLVHRAIERISIRLPTHVDVDDLLQSALVGLYNTINRFDPSHGVRFETFARPRIEGAILDELRAMDRVSRATRSLLQRIETTIRRWHVEHHAHPSEEELAREMNVSPSELAATLAQGQPLLSLDNEVLQDDGHSLTLKDVVADDRIPNPGELAARNDMRAQLHKAFLALSAREQKILYLFYFQELRLSEIAGIYDITAARVCQIHAMAVIKLRALLADKPEKPQP